MDHYKILGLTRDATPEEIREAYFDAARRLHPDTNPEPASNELFISAAEAFEVLSDPSRRVGYDLSLPPALPPPELQIDAGFSRKALLQTRSPQLFYMLMDLSVQAEPDNIQLPAVFICLVIDCSTSMQGERLDMIKSSAITLIKQLKPNDLISVVTFNDRAEVLIPPTRVSEVSKFENRIMQLNTGGGTELFRGLLCGYEQLLSFRGVHSTRNLILLTDGHTYGDEPDCLALADNALREKVAIIALGIGHEWNDSFLDKVGALSGGSAHFIRNNHDLNQILRHKLNFFNSLYAKGLRFDFTQDPHVSVNYAYRIQPDSAPIGNNHNLVLGNLVRGTKLSILFEFTVRDLSRDITAINLLKGKIWLDLVDRLESKARFFLDIKIPVQEKPPSEPPPKNILDAMSMISLYRLQEKARVEVIEGKIEQATRHLQYLATNMLSLGKRAIAHEILLEAEHIQKNHSYSPDGEKRIKYGTRALMLPSGMEENQ